MSSGKTPSPAAAQPVPEHTAADAHQRCHRPLPLICRPRHHQDLDTVRQERPIDPQGEQNQQETPRSARIILGVLGAHRSPSRSRPRSATTPHTNSAVPITMLPSITNEAPDGKGPGISDTRPANPVQKKPKIIRAFTTIPSLSRYTDHHQPSARPCADGARSNRLRLRENLGPKFRRQVAGRQQIDIDAEQ